MRSYCYMLLFWSSLEKSQQIQALAVRLIYLCLLSSQGFTKSASLPKFRSNLPPPPPPPFRARKDLDMFETFKFVSFVSRPNQPCSSLVNCTCDLWTNFRIGAHRQRAQENTDQAYRNTMSTWIMHSVMRKLIMRSGSCSCNAAEYASECEPPLAVSFKCKVTTQYYVFTTIRNVRWRRKLDLSWGGQAICKSLFIMAKILLTIDTSVRSVCTSYRTRVVQELSPVTFWLKLMKLAS